MGSLSVSEELDDLANVDVVKAIDPTMVNTTTRAVRPSALVRFLKHLMVPLNL